MRKFSTLLAAAAMIVALSGAEAAAQAGPRAQAMAASQTRAEAGALQDIGYSGVVSAGNVSTLTRDVASARAYARVANSANAAGPNARNNSAFVRQAGNNNEAYLSQENRNNAAYIAQIGDNHYVDMTQYGNDRTLVLQTRRGTLVREVPPPRSR